MLNAITAVYFIIGLIILFGVIIPVLHRLVQLSLTWSLVVIYLAILFGVVVDFSHLTNELRIILAVGSILVTLSYIYSQACKEATQRGEKLPTPEISLENKDRKLKFKLRRHPKPSEAPCCEDMSSKSTSPERSSSARQSPKAATSTSTSSKDSRRRIAWRVAIRGYRITSIRGFIMPSSIRIRAHRMRGATSSR